MLRELEDLFSKLYTSDMNTLYINSRNCFKMRSCYYTTRLVHTDLQASALDL